MINKRQYIILSFFLTRVLFVGGGFSLLIGISKNNLLFSAILGTLLGYFLLYLFYRKGSINKWWCILICIIILILNTLADTTLTSTYLLYNTPTLFILISFMLVILYGITKEMKVIGRVTEIAAPCSIIGFILGPIALLSLIKLDNLLPLFDTSFIDFLKGILVFTGSSLIPNLLLINYKNELKFKDISIGYLFGCLALLIISFFILSIYGSEFASIVRFPEYLILNKIEFSGYFSNVQNILVMEWIINLVISGLFVTKVLKNNLKNIYIFSTIILGIIFINEFVLNTSYVNILLVKNYLYFILGILIVIGLIMKKNKNLN